MIFLSASIPTIGREFFGTENVIAIREAVMAFTKVCMEYHLPFYFGGHPAISPLIWEVARDYSPKDFKSLIKIYQSSEFVGKTPKEVDFFENIIWTKKGSNITESVDLMRAQMFNENQTDIAVFAGGMDGVVKECKLIRDIYPSVTILPLATTGAAAFKLYKDLGMKNEYLENNYSYVSIFKKYLIKK